MKQQIAINSERLLGIIDEHGLAQLVKEPTRDDSILDLVLTNNVNIINNVRVIPGIHDISDHDMVLFEVNLACRREKLVSCKIYMRTKSDATRIKKDIANDFEDMKNESEDAKWNMFQHRLTGIMDSCIPHKFTTSHQNLPWFNRSFGRQARLKQRLYNRAKKSGRQSHWNKFKLVRKQLHKNLNRSRNDYLSDFLGDSVEQNPKAFWSHIKKLGKVGGHR